MIRITVCISHIRIAWTILWRPTFLYILLMMMMMMQSFSTAKGYKKWSVLVTCWKGSLLLLFWQYSYAFFSSSYTYTYSYMLPYLVHSSRLIPSPSFVLLFCCYYYSSLAITICVAIIRFFCRFAVSYLLASPRLRFAGLQSQLNSTELNMTQHSIHILRQF